jgi:hypothetical protein
MKEPEEVAIFRDFTMRFPNSDDSAFRWAVLDHIDALTAERDALAEKLARLATLAAEIADDLDGESNPALQARDHRDMQLVRLLCALLTTVP